MFTSTFDWCNLNLFDTNFCNFTFIYFLNFVLSFFTDEKIKSNEWYLKKQQQKSCNFDHLKFTPMYSKESFWLPMSRCKLILGLKFLNKNLFSSREFQSIANRNECSNMVKYSNGIVPLLHANSSRYFNVLLSRS